MHTELCEEETTVCMQRYTKANSGEPMTTGNKHHASTQVKRMYSDVADTDMNQPSCFMKRLAKALCSLKMVAVCIFFCEKKKEK